MMMVTVAASDPATYTENHSRTTLTLASKTSENFRCMAASARETIGAVHVHSLTTILKVPARRWLQSTSVLLTQVVGMRISLWCEVIQPYE